MAKDKDHKLFRGADDKAITFQRAVFIVCNLKRLIKRPKKENSDKHLGISDNNQRRKQSGSSANSAEFEARRTTGQASNLGAGGGGSSARAERRQMADMKDPVRRAFTLPSMICQTLTSARSGSAGRQADESGRLLLSRLQQVQNELRVEQNQPSGQQTYPAGLDLDTLRMSQSQSHNYSNDDNDIENGAATNINNKLAPSKPLSCLATPLRQRASQSHHSVPGHPERNKNGQWAASCRSKASLLCPVWALVMAELDQKQGADQFRASVAGSPMKAPSPLAYLMVAETQISLAGSLMAPDSKSLESSRSSLFEAGSDSASSRWSSAEEEQQQDGHDHARTTTTAADSNNGDHHKPARIQQQDHQPKLSQARRSGSDALLASHGSNISKLASHSGEPLLGDHPESILESCQQVSMKSKRTVKRRQPNRKQSTRPKTPSSAALLAPPNVDGSSGVDSVVMLARQRRLSVSNQGSLSVDQQALFSAVECRQLERARTILEEAPVNVNSLNGDKLTCLDIAVLLCDVEMVRLLLSHKAKESSAYLSYEERAKQLQTLYLEARRLVEDLARSLEAISPAAPQQELATSCPSWTVASGAADQTTASASQSAGQLMLATGSLLSSALMEEKQRQLQYWRRRLDLFMQMRYQFERLQVPSGPELAVLQVLSGSSLGVKIVHSAGLKTAPQKPKQAAQLDASKLRELALECPNGQVCSHKLLAGSMADLTLAAQLPSPPTANSAAQKERLAIFNQLLAQQLLLLSGQQQQRRNQQQQQHHQQQAHNGSLHQFSSETPPSLHLSRPSAKSKHQMDAFELITQPDRFAFGMDGKQQQPMEQIITKYKLEWSLHESMTGRLGSMIVYATGVYPLECQIEGLRSGQMYFVRVSAGNHRGFSRSRATTPTCLSPSSWRQVEGAKRRKYDEQVLRKFTKLILLNKHIIDERASSNLAAQMPEICQGVAGVTSQAQTQTNKSSLINMLLLDANAQPNSEPSSELSINLSVAPTAASSTLNTEPELEQAQQQSATTIRKNLRSFFQAGSKFYKLNNQNKRGLYLCTIAYSVSGDSERLVVTNDDRLPCVEVLNELVSLGALMSDFYWLLKINGTHWIDIKRVRQQLQRCHSASTLHLRIKLLAAVEQMQLALNMEDIGRLFYRPIQAHDGSIVICTCKQVASTKSISNLSTKWSQPQKIIPRHLRNIAESMQANSRERQQRELAKQTPANDLSASQINSTSLPQPMLPAITLGLSCEFCQTTTSSRRATGGLANGSSNSSLASESGGSHFSGGPVDSSRACTCGSTSASSHTMPNSAATSQRASSQSSRSASMISGSQRYQQQQQQHSNQNSNSTSQPQHASAGNLNPSQSASNYLMLASLSLYELLLFNLREIIHFDRVSSSPLTRGLYLGFVQLQTTVESMRLLVPRARPNMVPCSRVRDNAHVSREEWQLLRRFSTSAGPPNARNKGPLSGERPEERARAPAARVSDPSIWCETATNADGQTRQAAPPTASKAAPPVDQQPAGEAQLKPIGLSLAGFERGRAKSVSPGLMQQMADTVASNTNKQSVSSEQLPGSSGSFPNLVGPSRACGLSLASLTKLTPEETFVRLVGGAARRLLAELRAQLPKVWDENSHQLNSVLNSLDDQPNSRIYHLELIELNSQVTFILLIPSNENVCPVTTYDQSEILADNQHYMLLPLQIFETTHISTYEPDLLAKYSRLSAILETDLIVAQHEHRQAFSSTELKSTKSRLSNLQDMVAIADEFWRQLRWIVDVVSFARDKSSNCIRLANIWNHFDLKPLASQSASQTSCNLVGATFSTSAASASIGTAGRTVTSVAPIGAGTTNPSHLGPKAGSSHKSSQSLTNTRDNLLLRKVESSQPGSVCSTNQRRHSGDETNAARRPAELSAIERADLRASCESLEVKLHDGTSLLQLTFKENSNEESSANNSKDDQEDDDEQAIYAYHISLKDATRAVTKRKTSQQLTCNLLSQYDPFEWSFLPTPSTSQQSGAQYLPSTSEANSLQLTETSKPNQDFHSPTTQRRSKLKSTNPFLSDSFELSNK